MNIREELKSLRKELKSQYKKLHEIKKQLEPEITEGQYWEDNSGTVCRVANIEKDFYTDELPLIVDLQDLCSTKDIPLERCVDGFTLRERYTLLSDKEVEQALIKEAKRRGYCEGVKVNRPQNMNIIRSEGVLTDNGFYHSPRCDDLTLGNVVIYKQGQWAEIIEDEWEVQVIEGTVLVNSNDAVIDMSGMRGMTQKEAQAIANALNNLDND